jgi:hypothetical protein
MLLRAASDWDASIAIDNSGDEKETFCVAVSPDGAGLKVIRMTEKGLPKTLDFSDAGVQKAVGGNVLEMETDDIVTAVRGGF